MSARGRQLLLTMSLFCLLVRIFGPNYGLHFCTGWQEYNQIGTIEKLPLDASTEAEAFDTSQRRVKKTRKEEKKISDYTREPHLGATVPTCLCFPADQLEPLLHTQ